MKKQIIAIILSLAMASSSVGAVPALAIETTAEEAVAEQEEISDEQEEVSEVMEDSNFVPADEDVLNEENARTEEDPVQEETEDESDSDDEQEETADSVMTTEMAEEDEEEAAESEDGDEASAEVTETVEPLVIEEEIVTDEENEAGLAGDVVDSGKCGPNATWTLTGADDNLTLTISGSGSMDSYSESNMPWATKRSKIKTVIVEDGITNIGNHAFCYLSKLTKVALSDTVTALGWHAFSDCSSLVNVTLPDSVMTIEEAAFQNCNSLTSVMIPNGVTELSWVFEHCNSLTSITLPDSIIDIDGAFSGCSSLTSITIPNGVTDIRWAFSGCSNLTSITIPDSVTVIGDGAFSGCSSLTSVTIPDSVTVIDYLAFNECRSLTSVTIPDSVTIIGDNAFTSCSSLTSISIPDSVVKIAPFAFSYNSNLISVTVPDSVAIIGEYAFGKWEQHLNATIRFRGTKEQWDAAVGNNDVRFKAIIYNCFSVPADFTLSDTSFVYTGEAINPTVTVSYKGEKLVEGVDYKLEYKDNINAGTATVNVIGIGKYSGTEPLEYTIKPGKTTRGDLFNLADNIKITWEAVPGAKYYKVYRNGVTEPVVVTTGLVGWDKCTTPKLEPGKMYTYKIVASTTGKGDSSGDSTESYSKSIYRLQTTAFKYIKNTAPGKVTVSYKKSDYGDSYVLLYADNEEMKNAKSKVIYGADTTSVVLGGFKKGKTYWFQIRVRKSVSGYKLPFYTTFGAKKTVTIKK